MSVSMTVCCHAVQARAHRAKLLFGLAALGAAAELHGDMTQAARLASLDAFRKVCVEPAYTSPSCTLMPAVSGQGLSGLSLVALLHKARNCAAS